MFGHDTGALLLLVRHWDEARSEGDVTGSRRRRDESRHDEELGLLLAREPRQILSRVG